MIRDGVQRLQIHPDAGSLRQFGAGAEPIIQGDQLYGGTEAVTAIRNHAAGAQSVGMDGEAPDSNLPGRLC